MTPIGKVESALGKNWVRLLALLLTVGSASFGLFITNDRTVRALEIGQNRLADQFTEHYSSPTHSGVKELVRAIVKEPSLQPHPVSVSMEDYRETRDDVKALRKDTNELKIEQRLIQQSQTNIEEDLDAIQQTLIRIEDKQNRTEL